MKIAVLEDDRTQLQMVEQALIGGENHWDEPMECRLFSSGQALLQSLKEEPYDCLVLDRRVADMSGDVILQWVRQYATALHQKYITVIMLTNLRSEQETIQGLEAGADDYIYKPFRPKELVARIQRLVRAHKVTYALGHSVASAIDPSLNAAQQGGTSLVMQFNDYLFNQFEQRVTYKGESIDLTEREFSLALLLFKNLNTPLSRETIFEVVWKRADNPSSRALDTHVYRLRQRLNLNVGSGFVLRTVYGYGYRLDVAGQYIGHGDDFSEV